GPPSGQHCVRGAAASRAAAGGHGVGLVGAGVEREAPMNGCSVGSRRFGAGRAATGVLGWLIAFLTVLSATPAAATPVSPLQFPPSRTGQWAFDAAATVVPYGREMPTLDGQSRLTTETRLEYVLGASATIAYHVTDAVALSLSVEAGGIARRT